MDLKTFKQANRESQLGFGRKAIRRNTDLSLNQITYRRRVIKELMGLKKSLSEMWRDGEHPLQKHILSDYGGILDMEFDRQIMPKIVHPTPEVVEVKKEKPVTVDRAVADLKARKVGMP
jgi:hypothetical protein